MRRRILFGLLVLGVVVLTISSVGSAEPEAAKKVAPLIARLDSEQYAEREEATASLEALGAIALPALRKAAEGESAELRRRASELVRRIERRIENDKLLKAPRMRLVFKDTPLADALSRFSEAAGFDLRVEGDKEKLSDRKVTLDTGEVSFWEAFDRFCQETGLVEKATVPAQPRNNGNTTVRQVIIINGQIYQPEPAREETPEGRVVLVESKGTPPPTCYAGPIRIRAMPPAPSKTEGELLVGLETAADPRVRWEKMVGVRIRRAVDDQGQELTPVPVAPAERNTRTTGSSVVIINGQVMNDQGTSSDPRLALVRLRAGQKTAKKLAELSGMVSGLLLLPAERLLTIDDILKADGKSIEGVAGSLFKVVDVTKEENGLVRVRGHLEPPVSSLNDGTALYYTGRIIVNGRLIGDPPTPLHGAMYDLLDAKGQSYQLMDVDMPSSRGGGPREVRLTFLQKQGQGEPVKLVFSARRGAVVDVPFTLKDVPLP